MKAATEANQNAGEGLREPLDPVTRRRLRRAVVDHARLERRRHFPAVLRVGEPGGRHASLVLDPAEAPDHGLRTDVVAAMLRRTSVDATGAAPPVVWLTRSGDPGELQDVDARWLAAARDAGREAGRPLVFVVVGRHGWHDPRSGASRHWRRARDRSAGTAGEPGPA